MTTNEQFSFSESERFKHLHMIAEARHRITLAILWQVHNKHSIDLILVKLRSGPVHLHTYDHESKGTTYIASIENASEARISSLIPTSPRSLSAKEPWEIFVDPKSNPPGETLPETIGRKIHAFFRDRHIESAATVPVRIFESKQDYKEGKPAVIRPALFAVTS